MAPPDGAPEVKTLLDAHALPERTDFLVVPGGDSRQESVKLGLDALPPATTSSSSTTRPARSSPLDTVDAVIEAVRDGAPAVVPALPLADTVKEVRARRVPRRPGAGRRHPRAGPPPRRTDPQGFDRATLIRAHETVTDNVTDDASMVEQLGLTVVVVPGHEEAFEVTRPLDLVLAEAVLARRRLNDGF
ncbi:IspD/TarI family cytidylyltransferase [Streptomyces sp. L7]